MINPSQSQPTDLCPERWKGGGCFPKESIRLKHTLRTETSRWTRTEHRWGESVGMGDFIWEEFMKQIKGEQGLEEEYGA